MAVNTQFSIAVHMLAGLACQSGREMTSGYLAKSVNTSPSFVRRILSKLAKGGLVFTTTGKTGACRLVKKPAEISLLAIYQAVDAPKAFSIHAYREQKNCRVSCHIKCALDKALGKTQLALEQGLAAITLADILADLKAA